MIGHLHLAPDHRPEVGAGHLARCLALAEAWHRRGGSVTADIAAAVPIWADRYREAGVELGSPDAPATWTVVDDYRASRADQARRRGSSDRLAIIDDHGAVAPYDCDLVIDQNVGAVVRHRAAAGCSYAMLRPEFAGIRRRSRPVVRDARRVLLSVGGAPTASVTEFAERVRSGLTSAGLEVDLLVGASDVAERMAAADLAVAACGSTAYELACVGTPGVLVAAAENQEPVGEGLAAAHAAVYLGRIATGVGEVAAAAIAGVQALAPDHERRSALAAAGRRLVDGRGADRVVARMRSVELRLSDATMDDARLVWEWANDPDARSASFRPESIGWSDHVSWYTDRLASADTLILIAQSWADDPVGIVRFDRSDGVARISFSVAPAARGGGLGAPLLLAALDVLAERWPGIDAVGDVLFANIASVRSFELAGFEEHPSIDRADATSFRRKGAA